MWINKAFTFKTLALGGRQHGDKQHGVKIGIFLDNGNIFNIFKIQRDGNKIYQKDRY